MWSPVFLFYGLIFSLPFDSAPLFIFVLPFWLLLILYFSFSDLYKYGFSTYYNLKQHTLKTEKINL